MLMTKEPKPAYRAVESWAIRTLLEAGAIKECPDHGYIQCRADPDARAQAYAIAKEEPPLGLTADDALAAVHDVLGGIGDGCPEC
jgi:hypothetical protein